MFKICTKCNRAKLHCHFRLCRLYKGVTDGEYMRSECRSCEKVAGKQLRKAKVEAPPKPKVCDCCKRKTNNFVLDHDHKTGKFRGWLCRNCNQGIGKLGDDIKSLEKAIDYLRNKNV